LGAFRDLRSKTGLNRIISESRKHFISLKKKMLY